MPALSVGFAATYRLKRHAVFHDYRDELMDLLRSHGQEAIAVAA